MLYLLDNNGYVVNEAGVAKVQLKYRPVISDVIKLCTGILGNNLKSVMIRGSVSVGRAIPNTSDIDVIAVVNKTISKTKQTLIFQQTDSLEAKYPFVSLIDITVLSMPEFMNSKQFTNLKVYLKTQSFCAWGENIIDELPTVKPGKELAIQMYGNIESEFSDLKKIFEGIMEKTYLGKVQPISFWCVWLTRILLRSGLGLVMLKRPVYSQDLMTCCEVFSEEYPQYKESMEKALHYSLNPTNDSKEILSYINSFIPKFVELWKPILNDKHNVK
jgi:hypothetical protein